MTDSKDVGEPGLTALEVTDAMVNAAYVAERDAVVMNVPSIVFDPPNNWVGAEQIYSFDGQRYYHMEDAKRAQNKARLRIVLQAALAAAPPNPQPINGETDMEAIGNGRGFR